MSNCWDIQLKSELSQGDLLSLVLVGTAANPRKALIRGQTKRGGGETWDASTWKPDGNGIGHFLARGQEINVIVLSQDCEIDKDDGRAPVLVAPVFPISVIQDQEALNAVVSRKRYPFLPLPEIQGVIKPSYADLRCISYIDRKLIAAAERKKSMSANGVEELVKQIIAFFTHVPFEKLVIPSGT